MCGEMTALRTVTAPMGGAIPGPNLDIFDQKTPLGVLLLDLLFPAQCSPRCSGAAAPETAAGGFSRFDVS